jgi:serine/threonine protein kinase
MEKYKTVRVIGEGAFGKVTEALSRETGNIRVAIKQIKANFNSWDGSSLNWP